MLSRSWRSTLAGFPGSRIINWRYLAKPKWVRIMERASAIELDGAGSESSMDLKSRLRDLIDELSLLRSDKFELASGRSSKFYFDMKQTMLHPEGADLIASLLLDHMDRVSCRYIGGLAVGAVPIVSQAVLKSLTRNEVFGFFVREEKKPHCTEQQIYGHLPDVASGEPVVLCDDVTTTGGSVLKAVGEVRRLGLEIRSVVTIVDRLEGARENLAREGIELAALLTKEDFLE